MSAGCPCVVANLWDVTDKDIDRFCQALLLQWRENGTSAGDIPACGVQASDEEQAISYSQGVLPATANLADRKDAPVLFGAAVPHSRSACRLPFLIGAAPVVYGVPTAVSWGG